MQRSTVVGPLRALLLITVAIGTGKQMPFHYTQCMLVSVGWAGTIIADVANSTILSFEKRNYRLLCVCTVLEGPVTINHIL